MSPAPLSPKAPHGSSLPISPQVGTDGPLNVLSRWHKPWFFKHVESKLADGKPSVEYVPLRDYYHRHTHSMF